jgi:hypothetical protein
MEKQEIYKKENTVLNVLLSENIILLKYISLVKMEICLFVDFVKKNIFIIEVKDIL